MNKKHCGGRRSIDRFRPPGRRRGAQHILLLGDGLSRHARVHVVLYSNYELRVKLLTADPTRALAFRDSLAFEMRSVGRELGAQERR